MTSEVRSKKNLTPILLILIIMSVLTLTKFLILFAGWGEYFKNIIWAFDERPLFYDHFDHIKYSLQGNITGVYNVNVNACFPAFAYFFYGFLAHLCTVDQVGTADFAHVLNTNSGVVTLVFVYGIFFVSIALLLSKQLTSKIGEYYTNAFIILLLLSSIFLMTVASGNLTIGAMILTLFSLYFRDSKSAALRELSMIMLAMAASLKVYPAIWGLLYIKEKRYKDAIKQIIYGILFFLVPFAFFGGVGGFIQFIKNLAQVSKIVTSISLVGILHKFFSFFLNDQMATILARIIDYLYLITTVLLVFLRKKIDWKSYALFAGAMFIFNTESGSYCMIYWTIAIVAFVSEIGAKRDASVLEYIYAILFAVSFSGISVFGLGSSVIPSTCLYAIILIVIVDSFIELLPQKK